MSRFFDAALLDGATSELGSKATVERYQDARTLMGRKYYAIINYEWSNPAQMETFFNRSLCFDVFASNTKVYPPGEHYVEGGNEGISYVDNPSGYERDKKLLDWFVPKARLLYQAGWEPVTRARVSGGDHLYVERYGAGRHIYFTVFNDTPEPQPCVLKIDLQSLGFTAGTPDYRELAQIAEPERLAKDKVRLALGGYRTSLLQVTEP